ncbi:MAG: AbrB/MazE/SpoVT family DNA-binding domain-containing protein [Deltaproteobacteria bacterium]|nr:AbrB/MazE/SpoVT family DNA-binding domain-containing protein [Deltaproteobacteria bacterium]
MKTAVTKRGQTVIPSPLRKRYAIDEKTFLQWIDTGETIKVIPIPRDVLGALRGIAKGEKLLDTLLAERKFDKNRE